MLALSIERDSKSALASSKEEKERLGCLNSLLDTHIYIPQFEKADSQFKIKKTPQF